MESLEERVFMLMNEQYYYSNSNVSDQLHMHHHRSVSVENLNLWWENNTDSDDSAERILYWESQISLLQVYTYSKSFHYSLFHKLVNLMK